MFAAFNIQDLISAFIVLFAVIDIIGSIPIIIDLKEKGREVNAVKATLYSGALLVGFFLCRSFIVKPLPGRYRVVCNSRCTHYILYGTGNDS